jgi:DNA-binding beta-propeller fold protein YncE
MKRVFLLIAAGYAMSAYIAVAQGPATGPNKIVKTAKTGGDGGFDYIYADVDGRKLYIPRSGQPNPRIEVFNLDTLAPVGTVPNANARGAATDTKSGHGFVSSKPVVMFDTKTLAVIKTIPVDGGPDGILGDPFNQHIYIFSHSAPNATVINAADGSVLGTIDLGGAPEQAVTDGKGHIYVDLEDKDSIAVVDAKTMTVTAHYDIKEKGGGPGGLAMDVKNRILFAACHDPAVMVILNADTGKIITALPLDGSTDGAGFNPNTMEAFSSQGNGTLTVIKENSPSSFVVEQTVKTMNGAKTMTVDTKNNWVLTMAAEYGAPPAPAAPAAPPAGAGAAGAAGGSGRGGGRGRGPGRGPMVPDSFTILAIGTK